ncbi:MAG: porin family protein [Bacteroidia bacterium]
MATKFEVVKDSNTHLKIPRLRGVRGVLYFICSLFLLNANAQETGLLENLKLTADDTRHERFDRIVVDFYANRFLNAPSTITQGNFSFGISTYWYKDMPLGNKSRFSIAFGAGFSSHSVHHNGVFALRDSMGINDFVSFEKLSDSVNYYKNKIAFNYVDVPFELRFRNMDGKNKLRFYPGFKVGILVNDHTKWRDGNVKIKVYDLPNTLIYQYGVTVRLAWNKIALYGYYSLTPVFEKNKGTQISLVSVGISWIRF